MKFNEYLAAVDISDKRYTAELHIIFPYMSAFNIYDHFVDPYLLVRWWPPQVSNLDFRIGGEYEFVWPDSEKRLSGKYTRAEVAGEDLTFTWHWQDTSKKYIQEVAIQLSVDVSGSGCLLKLSHSNFRSARDRSDTSEQWMINFERLATYWGKRS